MSNESGNSEESSFRKLTTKICRMTTRELLGDVYQETVEGPLPPAPHPSRNSIDYDKTRVIGSLRFADETIRNPIRNLSPIGIQAVRLYKEACAKYLSLRETDDINKKQVEKAKKEYITTMRIMEQAFQSNLCLETTNTRDAQELQNELVSLLRTQFYARYGEYFAELCKEMRREAEMKKVAGWEKLQKSYWTEIPETIEEEK